MGINLEHDPEFGALWPPAASDGQLIRKSVKAA
jgi:hypothetical protein